MNNISFDVFRGIVQYAGLKPEEIGELRLVCRRWEKELLGDGLFKYLVSQGTMGSLVHRVCVRIRLHMPLEVSANAMFIRMLREMQNDVSERALVLWNLHSGLAPSHQPLQILTTEDLQAVEAEGRSVEQQWIAIVTRLLPQHLAVIQQGGTLNEICNRLLQQPTLSPHDIWTIVTTALNMDDGQVLRAAFASDLITQLTEDTLDHIDSELPLRKFNCAECCLFLAESPRGTQGEYLFRRIWNVAAAVGHFKALATLMQMIPAERFSAYISQAVANVSIYCRNPDILKMLLDSEQSDLIVPKALGLAFYCADLECRKIFMASPLFGRIPPEDLRRAFNKDLGRKPGHFFENLFYQYMLALDGENNQAAGITCFTAALICHQYHQYPDRRLAHLFGGMGLALIGWNLVGRYIQLRMNHQQAADSVWVDQRILELSSEDE